MILLDTCTILWLCENQAKLSKAAIHAWSLAEDHVYYSAISTYEIGQKISQKKLKINQALPAWVNELEKHFELKQLPITSEICIRATMLPPIHKDPFDRFIIATAITHKLSVVTCDEQIKQYPKIKTIW